MKKTVHYFNLHFTSFQNIIFKKMKFLNWKQQECTVICAGEILKLLSRFCIYFSNVIQMLLLRKRKCYCFQK